jgi:DNA-binding NarL/FixJ family response regulator
MVVDDHELFRQALCAVVDQEHDMTVVAVCGDGQEAVECLAQARPDVVVTDLVMPRLDGAATAAHIRGQQPGLPVLVLTGTPHGRLATAALAAGARAVLVKHLDRDDLVAAIRTAARDSGGRGGERLPGTARTHP